MAIDLRAERFRDLTELRQVATEKRVRALLDGETVLDSRAALLVWEPRRVTPLYAVPPGDIAVTLSEAEPAALPDDLPAVLSPVHPEWHTTPGRSLTLEGHGEVAFRPDDPALGGRVIVHSRPFTWMEEDEVVLGHPRDPYSRIDTARSSRHVRVLVGDVVVADSTRPVALFETGLPVRWYLPPEDVRTDLLRPSDTHTTCPYKGVASYLSAEDAPDVAWFYPEPLHDAAPVAGMLCFWRDAAVLVDDVRADGSMPGES
ncbi:conserved hypothetical protein [Nostocoides japonicum T1-X7]|uniref:DUF427 domain-containing protein n=1 Tax=Nostocoides japonicum T1-X7 TaxID=1194083 RepID=A0A077M6B7_9MICO|nr:DUF427 domain-containing protein [Tetrasphaera japonica]CCH79674.1 conserved hypothetical protein [Tetrasphaera japonica T1-X7]